MSYAKSDLGKIYNVHVKSPRLLPDADFSVDVPIELLTSDLKTGVSDNIKKELVPFFDKTLPYIKYKITTSVVPPVIDAIVGRLRQRQADVKKIVETTSIPLAKKTGLYVALGGIAFLTAFAVIQRRTR